MLPGITLEVVRNDVPRLVIGELILAAGLVALILHLLRAKAADRSTLYFGLAAVLYGLRLLAQLQLLESVMPGVPWRTIEHSLTLVVGIPFILYFGSTIARKYHWVTYGALGVAILLGLVGARNLVRGLPMGLIWHWNGVLTTAFMLVYIYISFVPHFPIDREVRVLRAGLIVLGVFAISQNLSVIGILPQWTLWEPLGLLFLLGTFFYVSAQRSLRTESSLIALRNELEIARQIQFTLLPKLEGGPGEVEVHARYVPAGAVAGDFYDVLSNGQGLGVLIADVSGHGVPAALSASMLKVALHAQAAQIAQPEELLAGLNRTLNGMLVSQFVTAAYVFIDTARRELYYAGAGHPPILVWRCADGRVEQLLENGLLLGPFLSAKFTTRLSTFAPGDRCLLYTDGLVEAMSRRGEEFGAERLSEALASSASAPAGAACDALLAQVTEWSRGSVGGQEDDLTFVLVEFRRPVAPDSPAPADLES